MGEINETTISPPVSQNTFINIVHWLYEAYNFLVQLIAHVLQMTIFQQDPQLANTYANLLSWLIPMTAIYIILVFASTFKKIIGYALIAGWGFILLMLILAKVG